MDPVGVHTNIGKVSCVRVCACYRSSHIPIQPEIVYTACHLHQRHRLGYFHRSQSQPLECTAGYHSDCPVQLKQQRRLNNLLLTLDNTITVRSDFTHTHVGMHALFI